MKSARSIPSRARDWAVVAAAMVGLLLCGGCTPGATQGGPTVEPTTFVVTAEVKRQSVTEALAQVGSILADESVELNAENDGIVEKILFEEGQVVEAGQRLIQLEESKLAAMLAEAEANFELSRANFERGKQLFQDHLISQQEYDQVVASFSAHQASLALKRRQLKDARICAPFAGVVGARQVSPGQVISKNMTLTWLVDLDPVKLEVNMPERYLGQVHVGQKLQLSVAAYPGAFFEGEVYFIAAFVDLDTRTAQVKARVPNREGKLLPGMYAILSLGLQTRENALVIPESGLVKLIEDPWATVYVVDAQERAQLKRIEIGVRLPGLVEVRQGLQAGDRVIIEGTQKVSPDGKVKARAAEAQPSSEPNRPTGPEKPDKSIGS